MTFQELDKAAAALGYDNPLREQVNHLIAHAADNAEFDNFEPSAMASLEGLLCYEDSREVREWFVLRGVWF